MAEATREGMKEAAQIVLTYFSLSGNTEHDHERQEEIAAEILNELP